MSEPVHEQRQRNIRLENVAQESLTMTKIYTSGPRTPDPFLTELSGHIQRTACDFGIGIYTQRELRRQRQVAFFAGLASGVGLGIAMTISWALFELAVWG